jgi:hypothetical protein
MESHFGPHYRQHSLQAISALMTENRNQIVARHATQTEELRRAAEAYKAWPLYKEDGHPKHMPQQESMYWINEKWISLNAVQAYFLGRPKSRAIRRKDIGNFDLKTNSLIKKLIGTFIELRLTLKHAFKGASQETTARTKAWNATYDAASTAHHRLKGDSSDHRNLGKLNKALAHYDEILGAVASSQKAGLQNVILPVESRFSLLMDGQLRISDPVLIDIYDDKRMIGQMLSPHYQRALLNQISQRGRPNTQPAETAEQPLQFGFRRPDGSIHFIQQPNILRLQ